MKPPHFVLAMFGMFAATMIALNSCTSGAAHGVPTRTELEAKVDAVCAERSKVRALEEQYGLGPVSSDAGVSDAGSK